MEKTTNFDNILVTDDTGFQKYVNEMIAGLAIGIEQFWDEIKNNRKEKMRFEDK